MLLFSKWDFHILRTAIFTLTKTPLFFYGKYRFFPSAGIASSSIPFLWGHIGPGQGVTAPERYFPGDEKAGPPPISSVGSESHPDEAEKIGRTCFLGQPRGWANRQQSHGSIPPPCRHGILKRDDGLPHIAGVASDFLCDLWENDRFIRIGKKSVAISPFRISEKRLVPKATHPHLILLFVFALPVKIFYISTGFLEIDMLW